MMEQFKPPGKYRLYSRKNRFRGLNYGLAQSRDKLGSLSGSSHNMLGSTKLLNLQEDARSHKITSEVMKQRLYESVVHTPRRRKLSMSLCSDRGEDDDLQQDFGLPFYARMAMSVPATPAVSQKASPLHSPTWQKTFFYGIFSREHSPLANTPEDCPIMMEESNSEGIASIFNPEPRCIPGARWEQQEAIKSEDDESEKSSVESQIRLQDPPTPKRKSSPPMKTDSSGI